MARPYGKGNELYINPDPAEPFNHRKKRLTRPFAGIRPKKRPLNVCVLPTDFLRSYFQRILSANRYSDVHDDPRTH